MKMIRLTLAWIALAASALGAAWAAPLTAEEIVERANQASLYQGRDSKGAVSMVITDSQGRARSREFRMLRLNTQGPGGDQKYYTFFKVPADVRKMVFMVHKHVDLNKDDDRWLYLPGLDLVKRIAASDKRTSFVGSDFLYEDISGRSPAEDRHELAGEDGACYILKNYPLRPHDVEFEYYVARIDKKTFLPVKMEFFKAGDRLYRTMEAVEIRDVAAKEEGRAIVYPTVCKSVVKNLETGGRTVMTFSDVQYNTGLNEKIFTERYLRRPPREAMR